MFLPIEYKEWLYSAILRQIFFLPVGYKSSICPQGKNLLFARRAYSIVGYTNI